MSIINPTLENLILECIAEHLGYYTPKEVELSDSISKVVRDFYSDTVSDLRGELQLKHFKVVDLQKDVNIIRSKLNSMRPDVESSQSFWESTSIVLTKGTPYIDATTCTVKFLTKPFTYPSYTCHVCGYILGEDLNSPNFCPNCGREMCKSKEFDNSKKYSIIVLDTNK